MNNMNKNTRNVGLFVFTYREKILLNRAIEMILFGLSAGHCLNA